MNNSTQHSSAPQFPPELRLLSQDMHRAQQNPNSTLTFPGISTAASIFTLAFRSSYTTANTIGNEFKPDPPRSGISTAPQLNERSAVASGVSTYSSFDSDFFRLRNATTARPIEHCSRRLALPIAPRHLERDSFPLGIPTAPRCIERDTLRPGISTASISFVNPKNIISPDVAQRMSFWETVLEKNNSQSPSGFAPAQNTSTFLDVVLNKDTPVPKVVLIRPANEIVKAKRKRKVKVTRAFKCGTCTSAFKRRYDLNQHVDAVHLKKQPFKCDECPKSFAHNGTRRKHVRTVHRKEKPFVCGINGCDRLFSEKGNLNKHIARKLRRLRENSTQ